MFQVLMMGTMLVLLASLSAGQKKPKLPFPVPLNHFFLVLDAATYRAIESSEFMRQQFAASETRTTVRTDLSYTGLYFYGSRTYFEFFDATKATDRRIGDAGVAFGIDQAGGTETLKTLLDADFMPLPTITRRFGDAQVSWFFMTAPKNFTSNSGLSTWIMEYHPQFLMEWHPERKDQEQGITRDQILKRYVAVLKDAPAQPYMKDVLGLTIAADEATTRRMTELAQMLGYASSAEGDAKVLKGADLEMKLIPETASARGIREVIMRVNRRPEKQTEFRFGPQSVLKFEKHGLAVWSF